MSLKIGLKVVQSMPTQELMRHGATGGFFKGMIVDFDARTITVARHSDRKEVQVPRHLFDPTERS